MYEELYEKIENNEEYLRRIGLEPGSIKPDLEGLNRVLRAHLSHVPFEFVWGGTTAFTMNGAPAFGQVDEGVYASGGCNGAGITKGTVLGRGLAEIIKGGADPAALKALTGEASFIAPEPFRTVGFEVISRIERRKAGLES